MKSTFPETNCNLSNCKTEVIALPSIAMYRFETIFDTLAEEPNTMTLTEKVNGHSSLLESIFRMRVWRQKGITRSWSIYADDREIPKHIILRSVVWDMDKDMMDITEAVNRELVLNSWPDVEIKNIYLCGESRRNILSALQRLDLFISNGITFVEAEKPLWKWRDLELVRKYDWGQVHATWNPTRRNDIVENQMQFLSNLLADSELEVGQLEEYALKLNYRADWKANWDNGKC